MGVDFITCAICEYNFPDCGDFEWCDGCETYFCSQECGKVVEDDDGHRTCVVCRHELALDSDLLAFALRRLGTTKEQLTEDFLREQKGNA